MKVFAFALLALAVFGWSDLSDLVSTALGLVKALLPEQLIATDKVVTIPDNIIETGTITVNEASLTGLADVTYTVTDASTETRVEYSIELADLKAVVDLALDITGLLTVDHGIYVGVDLKDIKIEGYGELNDDQTELTDFYLLLTLGSSEASKNILVQNVVSDEYSEQLSTELSEKVPEVVNEITNALAEPVSDIIRYAVNIILKILL
ncbi:hypothetical protein NQ317_018535 [Molorchus minor]|uniref:Uncharacterized protein n=1 Tax=Molorchus minor TaxID=1323400 RepID=A0ABQ9JXC1_9CUCU|nr:hypothetical protein NQ317_018535 [Molorchus minor]